VAAWPEPVERVATALRVAAVDARIEEFREGTATAREAARVVGCELAQVVKSIVFVCDGAYVLALVPGDRRADEHAVARAVGASEVRGARAEEVVEATGFEPGAVAPFPRGRVADVLMDAALFHYPVLWAGAGSESHLLSLAPAELQRLAGARSVDLTARG
jgi:prolyl-tRNA editing enzyme YbaK/EbsC (Cys-tRNA(Pro) deacylase)